MTTVVPPQPLPQPMPPAPLPVVLVPNPPAALTQQALGALLKGAVVQQDAKGVFQLQTSLGAFSIQTPLILPRGALLTMQLHSLRPQAQLQILAINGKAPRQSAAGLQGQTQGGRAPTAAGARPGVAAARTPLLNLTVGSTVTATLIRSPQGLAGGLTRGLAGGQAGGRGGGQAGRLPQPGAPAPQGATKGAPAASAAQGRQSVQGHLGRLGRLGRPAAASAAPASAQGAPRTTNSSPGAQAPFPAGSRVGVKVVSIQPARPGGPLLSLPQAGSATLSAGRTLNAVVTGATPSGGPIVMTGAGEMSLAARASLPEGASLILQVIGKPTLPQAPLQTFIHGAGAGMFVSRQWPGLSEAMAAMQEFDPATAQQLLNNVMPRANSQLAANVLFFLSALRGGNLRNWLGDGPNRALQSVKPSLLNRLRDDFNALGRMSREPTPTGDWRISLVPFYNGAELEQIRMLTRRHGGEGEDGEEQENTRFIIDVDLTKLGRLQLDGLLKNKGKHMDLIVRTENRLPEKMQNGIRGIFQEASDLTGVKGGVSFQASPPNFIEVAVEKIADDGGKDGLIV